MDEYNFTNDGWDYGPGNQDDYTFDSGSLGIMGPSYELSNDFMGPPSGLQNQDYGPPEFLKNGGQYDFEQFTSPSMEQAPPNWQPTEQGGFMSGLQQMFQQPTPDFEWNPNARANMSGGGTQQFLKNLFSGPGATKILAALAEGNQNKRAAQQQRNSISQLQPMMDPFGQQRAQYQQLLSQTYTDPNVVLNRPEIAAQLGQMRQSMDAKDAAAGRRSQYGSREVQLSQQAAGLVDKYRAQLAQLAGAQFGPNGGAAAQMTNLANLYDANGYTSPLFNAIEKIQQDSDKQVLADKVLAAQQVRR
jgi:hypothetical protein